MQYQKRGYTKTYDENGHLISKVRIGSEPIEETTDVESDEELGDE